MEKIYLNLPKLLKASLGLGMILLFITHPQSISYGHYSDLPHPSEPQIQDDKEKTVVAIYPFTSHKSYRYEHAAGLGNAVEAGFVRSGRFIVVERNQFDALSEEDMFQEVSASEIINQAKRLGAKIIVTGHVVGVSEGRMLDSRRRPTGKLFTDVSVSFKIIDVETGAIEMSETINGRGIDQTTAAATQVAYQEIDRLARAHVGMYLPQRFALMSVESTKERKSGEFLETFKIWAGSDHGLQEGDVLQIYQVSLLTNPNTQETVEEKKLLGEASITEINSGSTSTCRLYQAPRNGVAILEMINNEDDSLVIEYQGSLDPEKKSLQDILLGN
jgi:curli biogenesis system outer membrane secretion channel CsgG